LILFFRFLAGAVVVKIEILKFLIFYLDTTRKPPSQHLAMLLVFTFFVEEDKKTVKKMKNRQIN